MLAKYDIQNPAALRRLVANGTQLRPYTREIMEAAYKAAFSLMASWMTLGRAAAGGAVLMDCSSDPGV